MLRDMDDKERKLVTEAASPIGRKWLSIIPYYQPLRLSDYDIATGLSYPLLSSINLGNCLWCGDDAKLGHDEVCLRRPRATINPLTGYGSPNRRPSTIPPRIDKRLANRSRDDGATAVNVISRVAGDRFSSFPNSSSIPSPSASRPPSSQPHRSQLHLDVGLTRLRPRTPPEVGPSILAQRVVDAARSLSRNSARPAPPASILPFRPQTRPQTATIRLAHPQSKKLDERRVRAEDTASPPTSPPPLPRPAHPSRRPIHPRLFASATIESLSEDSEEVEEEIEEGRIGQPGGSVHRTLSLLAVPPSQPRTPGQPTNSSIDRLLSSLAPAHLSSSPQPRPSTSPPSSTFPKLRRR